MSGSQEKRQIFPILEAIRAAPLDCQPLPQLALNTGAHATTCHLPSRGTFPLGALEREPESNPRVQYSQACHIPLRRGCRCQSSRFPCQAVAEMLVPQHWLIINASHEDDAGFVQHERMRQRGAFHGRLRNLTSLFDVVTTISPSPLLPSDNERTWQGVLRNMRMQAYSVDCEGKGPDLS